MKSLRRFIQRYPLLVVLVALVAVAIILARVHARQTQNKVTIAFVTNNTADFWSLARLGCEKAARELTNTDIDFRLPGEGTAAEQKQIVDDLSAKGDAAVAISPVDPANQVLMLDHIAKHRPLVTDDSDAPQSKRLCYLGTDNVLAGREAGTLMREALPAGGDIMLFVGKMDAQNAQERYRGFREALTGSKLRILDVRTDNADVVRAKANAADALVRYPQLAGMVGLWGYNGPAILNAVREAGRLGKVQIVAFDEERDTLSGIRDGEIYAAVVQQPFEFGYRAVLALEKSSRGDNSWVPPGGRIFIPTLLIRRQNVNAFIAHMTKMREGARNQ